MSRRHFDLPPVLKFGQQPGGCGDALQEQRDHAFRRIILSIPPGRVSTYGRVAAAAGYPRYHRAVARLLRSDPPDRLPWHRVLGAGGQIKLRCEGAREQRARLELEGVCFRGESVEMDRFEHTLRPWETTDADGEHAGTRTQI